MTTTLAATDKDFEQMMQMLGGFFVTQITSAAYSVADHLAKGPATAEQISKICPMWCRARQPRRLRSDSQTAARHWPEIPTTLVKSFSSLGQDIA